MYPRSFEPDHGPLTQANLLTRASALAARLIVYYLVSACSTYDFLFPAYDAPLTLPCHRSATTLPPLCHHSATALPSLCHHSATALPPLCHHSAITLPSLCHHSAITLPPLCHHSATALPSLCHHSAITLPSLCHHSATARLFCDYRWHAHLISLRGTRACKKKAP
jgi:hypothetical protein